MKTAERKPAGYTSILLWLLPVLCLAIAAPVMARSQTPEAHAYSDGEVAQWTILTLQQARKIGTVDASSRARRYFTERGWQLFKDLLQFEDPPVKEWVYSNPKASLMRALNGERSWIVNADSEALWPGITEKVIIRHHLNAVVTTAPDGLVIEEMTNSRAKLPEASPPANCPAVEVKEYGGSLLGIEIDDGLIFANDVRAGGPADRAGLKLGDLIIEVDGKPTQDISYCDAIGLLRGAPGSTMKLKVARKGVQGSFIVSIVRERIRRPD